MSAFSRKWTLDRQKYLSGAEVRKLRRAAGDKALADLQQGRAPWLRFWITMDLAFSAGLRVSEIVSVWIGNLNPDGRKHYMLITGKRNRIRGVFISTDRVRFTVKNLKP